MQSSVAQSDSVVYAQSGGITRAKQLAGLGSTGLTVPDFADADSFEI